MATLELCGQRQRELRDLPRMTEFSCTEWGKNIEGQKPARPARLSFPREVFALPDQPQLRVVSQVFFFSDSEKRLSEMKRLELEQ